MGRHEKLEEWKRKGLACPAVNGDGTVKMLLVALRTGEASRLRKWRSMGLPAKAGGAR